MPLKVYRVTQAGHSEKVFCAIAKSAKDAERFVYYHLMGLDLRPEERVTFLRQRWICRDGEPKAAKMGRVGEVLAEDMKPGLDLEALEKENRRLKRALKELERLAEIAMNLKEPGKVLLGTRAALEEKC